VTLTLENAEKLDTLRTDIKMLTTLCTDNV